MTTSFSLLLHGDVWNSLKANFAGTILATLGMLYVPWSILSAWRRRLAASVRPAAATGRREEAPDTGGSLSSTCRPG